MEQIARNPKQLGAALRRRRKSLGLMQAGLGEKTSHRQATISGLETGEAHARLTTLFDVLRELELELVLRPRTKASSDDIEELF